MTDNKDFDRLISDALNDEKTAVNHDYTEISCRKLYFAGNRCNIDLLRSSCFEA